MFIIHQGYYFVQKNSDTCGLMHEWNDQLKDSEESLLKIVDQIF